MTPDDLVTVLVTTSPAPLHPSTEHIEETIASVRAQLPLAEVIVVCDGVRPEQEDRRADYEEYQRRLMLLCEHSWASVLPVRMEEWGHQANAVRAGLDAVRTPLLLFVEHDTPLVGEIDWPALCALAMSGEANAIRFHFDVAIHADHEPGMVDHETRWWGGSDEGTGYVSGDEPFGGLPVRRTKTWWQRPHVARADFYRSRVMPLFSPESRTMIEDLLYGVVSSDHLERGEAAWWDWRLWLYTPEHEVLGMKRSSHLDSRGDAPKFDMKFV